MADFDIRGRVALVTGGGTGIGRGVSEGLAEAGATVIIAGRRREVAETAAAELRAKGMSAEGMQVDVTNVGEIGRLLARIKQRHGKLDILVTSAGTNRRKPMLDYDEASWDVVLGTNLKGAFFTSQGAARLMKEGGYGASYRSAPSLHAWHLRCRAAIARARPGWTEWRWSWQSSSHPTTSPST